VAKSGGKRKDFPTLTFLDWLSCFAISVNEENACGGTVSFHILFLIEASLSFVSLFFFLLFLTEKGRVVTAPTNGAAGSNAVLLL